MYAIYVAIKEFDYLLSDIHFELRTDHDNHTKINNKEFQNSKKVLNWKIEIQQYDFHIKHIAGKKNIVADKLSRTELTETSKEIVEGLNELNTDFPMETLKEIVDNYPDKIQFSLDAGNYLCNYIYYKSLNQFKTGNIVFIHIADYLNSNNAVSVSDQTNIIHDLINSHIYS